MVLAPQVKVRVLVVFWLAAIGSGCTCGASSHELDAGRDAAFDAPVVSPDAGSDGGGCWRSCAHEESRVMGSAILRGAEVSLRHAHVHSSHAFAVYLRVDFFDREACDGPGALSVSLDDGDPMTPDPADPVIGENVVVVRDDTGPIGLGRMDVTAWTSPGRPLPSGRLAARLVVSLPTVDVDLAFDVTPCAAEDGP